MTLRPIFFVLGALLCFVAMALLLPAAIDIWDGSYHDASVFIFCSCFSLFFGGALYLSNRDEMAHLSVRESFLLTNLVWICVILIGALPLYFSTSQLSFFDAFFEATSGVTTTGATILTQLETLPRGLLLWRAILQWLGGVGIIVMAVSLLPLLQVGGMQMFRAEAFEQSDKILPRAKEIALSVLFVYFIMTVLGAIALMLCGLNWFDALCHTLTAISTGGFSTYDNSIAQFDQFSVEFIIWIMMLLGCFPFMMLLAIIHSRFTSWNFEPQVQLFLLLVFLFGSFATAVLMVQNPDYSLMTAIRMGFFNTTSIFTGTGFVSADYSSWGSAVLVVMLISMFIGGCSGSTTCGIKIFRVQVLFAAAFNQLRQLSEPRGIFIARYNNKPISDDVIRSVFGFVFLFLLSFVLVIFLLGLTTDMDFLSLVSVAATMICNVGPGLGAQAGPTGNFTEFSNTAKFIMSVAMILGRLEIYSVLLLLIPSFWRP